MVYSAAKPIVATCVHLLAERGLLDCDAAIAEYWPAFAAIGAALIAVGRRIAPSPRGIVPPGP